MDRRSGFFSNPSDPCRLEAGKNSGGRQGAALGGRTHAQLFKPVPQTLGAL